MRKGEMVNEDKNNMEDTSGYEEFGVQPARLWCDMLVWV